MSLTLTTVAATPVSVVITSPSLNLLCPLLTRMAVLLLEKFGTNPFCAKYCSLEKEVVLTTLPSLPKIFLT